MKNDIATASILWTNSPHYKDFTARQMAILAIVCDEPGPHRVRDLAKRIKASAPVITRIHIRFSEQGWLMRVADPEDLRDCQLQPTEKGRELRALMRAATA